MEPHAFIMLCFLF